MLRVIYSKSCYSAFCKTRPKNNLRSAIDRNFHKSPILSPQGNQENQKIERQIMEPNPTMNKINHLLKAIVLTILLYGFSDIIRNEME